MPRTPFILALAIALSLWAVSAQAETTVHGFKIPTVSEGEQPSLEVCTTTGDPQQWANRGSNRTGVMLCQPRPENGVRPVNIPQEVSVALHVIEASVNFNHDSIELDESEMWAVRIVAEWLNEASNASIHIAGYTDATGTEAYNMALSERRAREVAAFLTANGVDSSRIILEWFGESDLLINTQKRERRNRRVKLTPEVK